MKHFLIPIAAVSLLFCSCVKTTVYGTFQIQNASDRVIHVESTFESADGSTIHTTDLEPWDGTYSYFSDSLSDPSICILCRSRVLHESAEVPFEDVVKNASEGKVTLSCEGTDGQPRVIMEWTAEDKDMLREMKSMSYSHNNFYGSEELVTGWTLFINQELIDKLED